MDSAFTQFMDSIDPYDEYGFHIRPHLYWLPEPVADEQKRLEFNIAIYEEFIRNGFKFPREVHEQRQREYIRVRFLKKGLEAA